MTYDSSQKLSDRIDVDVVVIPPNLSYLKDQSVERFVVTELKYAGQKLRGDDGKEVSTLEYVAGAAQIPRQTLKGTFDRNTQDTSLEYSSLVAYADGTPSFCVASNKQSDYLDLGSVDIGVLNVLLNPIDLPWVIISSAKVDLKYGDWEKSVTLEKGDTPTSLVKPFGRALTEPLKYKVTLNLTAGATYVGPETEVTPVRGDAELFLRNPLGGLNQIRLELDDAVNKAQLGVEYTFKSDGPDLVLKQLIQLDRSKPETATFDWRGVPGLSKIPSSLRVTEARVTTADGAKDLTDLSGGVIDPVENGYSEITVLSDGLSSF